MAGNRSPNYPAISLREAIEKINKIFEIDGRSEMLPEVAMQNLDYKGLSGKSRMVLSALRKYGLLVGSDNGVKVSEDAIRIIAGEHSDDKGKRNAALLKAFNSSELFVALASRFGTDSSERNISSQLMTEGFAKDGATKAAKAYIASIEFVVKETGGYTQNEQTNSGDTVDPVKADPAKIDPAKADPAKWNPPPPPHTSKEMSAVNYTFPSGETVTFNVPLGIVVDEDELQDFTDWVDLMTRKIKRGVKVAKQEKGVADSDE